jgi:hypothetical protein
MTHLTETQGIEIRTFIDGHFEVILCSCQFDKFLISFTYYQS